MAKQPSIEQDGVITEALSNAMFRVELENWQWSIYRNIRMWIFY